MSEMEKIVFEIITLLYPDWIKVQKDKYQEKGEFERYKHIILDVFGYDMERFALEQERSADISDLERRIEIMKLIKKLKESDKQKKGKK